MDAALAVATRPSAPASSSRAAGGRGRPRAPAAHARAGDGRGAGAHARCCCSAHIWDSPQLQPLRDRPAAPAVGAVAALVAVGVVAWLFVRRRALLPLLAVAALPFRDPDRRRRADREPARAAVPRGRRRRARLARAAAARGAPDADERPRGRAGVGAARAASSSTACRRRTRSDFDRALEQVVFFYVPFALLFVLLERVRVDAAAAAAVPRGARRPGDRVRRRSASWSTRRARCSSTRRSSARTSSSPTSASTRSSSTRTSTGASSSS